jgi:hypothetical protein
MTASPGRSRSGHLTVGRPIISGRRAEGRKADKLVVSVGLAVDARGENGIKAWVICPCFVDIDMGCVVPGDNPANFLTTGEVVDVVRYLLHTSGNVKLGPQILLRIMRNPTAA